MGPRDQVECVCARLYVCFEEGKVLAKCIQDLEMLCPPCPLFLAAAIIVVVVIIIVVAVPGTLSVQGWDE